MDNYSGRRKDKREIKNIIAIIPARGGSKRIQNKNLVQINDIPLIVYSIKHALETPQINEVIVSTDDPETTKISRENGAKVITRPKNISDDKATSESALIHVLDERVKLGLPDPDAVVFLQCTSPIRESDDISNAIELYEKEKSDSLFSACVFNKLIWMYLQHQIIPINYDYENRKREQDIDKQYQENGSIYITNTKILRDNNNRLYGKKSIYLMDNWSSFQIDEPKDIELLSWMLQNKKDDSTPKIDLVVLDFDGVMTDNTFILDKNKNESVVCHRGDGLGISKLRQMNIPVIVLSTETNDIVKIRCEKLKLKCYSGIEDKWKFLSQYLKDNKIKSKNVAYLGNDINDKKCLEMVGCPVVTADAHPTVKSIAKIILQSCGGKGAVRELYDHIK